MIKQISRALLTHREDLKDKNLGAVMADLTRVVWVQMLTRPITKDHELKKTWKLRPKFNSALEKILDIERYMHVINIPNMEEFRFFDSKGELTSTGKEAFWKHLNTEIRRLDFNLAEAHQKLISDPVRETNKLRKTDQARRTSSHHDRPRPERLPRPDRLPTPPLPKRRF